MTSSCLLACTDERTEFTNPTLTGFEKRTMERKQRVTFCFHSGKMVMMMMFTLLRLHVFSWLARYSGHGVAIFNSDVDDVDGAFGSNAGGSFTGLSGIMSCPWLLSFSVLTASAFVSVACCCVVKGKWKRSQISALFSWRLFCCHAGWCSFIPFCWTLVFSFLDMLISCDRPMKLQMQDW